MLNAALLQQSTVVLRRCGWGCGHRPHEALYRRIFGSSSSKQTNEPLGANSQPSHCSHSAENTNDISYEHKVQHGVRKQNAERAVRQKSKVCTIPLIGASWKGPQVIHGWGVRTHNIMPGIPGNDTEEAAMKTKNTCGLPV